MLFGSDLFGRRGGAGSRRAISPESETAVDRRADAARHHHRVASRRAAGAGGGGGIGHPRRRHPPRRRDQSRGSAAACRRHRRRARRQRDLGDQHARLQHQHRQQDSRPDRRPHRSTRRCSRERSGRCRTCRWPISIASRSSAARAARSGAPTPSTASSTSSPRAPPTRRACRSCSARARKSGRSRPCSSARRRASFDYRVYGKFRARDGQVLASGVDADDGVKYGQAGFRARVPLGQSRDGWLVQGDAVRRPRRAVQQPRHPRRRRQRDGTVDAAVSLPASQFRAQAYFDHVYRRVFAQFRGVRNTVDLDLQQQFTSRPPRAGRRRRPPRPRAATTRGNAAFHFDPQCAPARRSPGCSRRMRSRSCPARFAVIVGSKFERNTFTGLEAQPSVRVRWTPSATPDDLGRGLARGPPADALRYRPPVHESGDRRRHAHRHRSTSRPRR